MRPISSWARSGAGAIGAVVVLGLVTVASGSVSAQTASTSTASKVSPSGNLTLKPGGDLTLDPTGNDVLPETNFDINLGMLSKKYLSLHAAELWVETLVAQNTIATIAGRILVGRTTTLTRDLSTVSNGPYVKHNAWSYGDVLYLEANGSVEFWQVIGWVPIAVSDTGDAFEFAGNSAWRFTDGVKFAIVGSTGNDGTWTTQDNAYYDSGTGRTVVTVAEDVTSSVADGYILWVQTSGQSEYQYHVTRDYEASGTRHAWYAGDAVFDTGTPGNGHIDIYSERGVKAATEYGPTIAGNVRTGTAYNAWSPRWAVGNLNGLYGYSANTYGAAFGDNSASWVKIDPTNGVRLGNGATTSMQITPAGSASFTGSVTVTGGNAAKVDLSNVTAGYAGSATAGGSATNTVNVGGIAAATVAAWANVTDTTYIEGSKIYTGTIAAGSIAAGTITADKLNADLVLASKLRSSGATALSTGTGFWLDTTSTPTFRVGNPTGNYLKWDGSALKVKGEVEATSGSFSGAITATSGSFAAGSYSVDNTGFRYSSTSGMTGGSTGLSLFAASGKAMFFSADAFTFSNGWVQTGSGYGFSGQLGSSGTRSDAYVDDLVANTVSAGNGGDAACTAGVDAIYVTDGIVTSVDCTGAGGASQASLRDELESLRAEVATLRAVVAELRRASPGLKYAAVRQDE